MNRLDHQLRFRDWKALRYWLIWTYEGPVPEHAHIGEYGVLEHPNISCWLIRCGSVTVKSLGNTVTAHKGQWIFVSTGKRHQHFSPDCEILSIHLGLYWPGNIPVIEQPKSYVFDASKFPELEKASIDMVRSVEAHFPKAGSDLAQYDSNIFTYLEVQHQLPLWLKYYLKIQASYGVVPNRLDIEDSRILHAINELDVRPMRETFSETELVELVGLSQSRLNFLFTRATGVTPKRYYERRRLEAAYGLLRSTDLSIKEIGFDLGFNFDSHFTSWFRKQAGTTPSMFRKTAKG
jgi:AraC-like DNA-binding protein